MTSQTPSETALTSRPTKLPTTRPHLEPTNINPQTGSNFFKRLPAEIRTHIIGLVYESITLAYCTPHKKRYKSVSPHCAPTSVPEASLSGKPKAPALIFCCKRLYVESLGLLYQSATFWFEGPFEVALWAMSISSQYQALIQNAVVHSHLPSSKLAEELYDHFFEEMTGLKGRVLCEVDPRSSFVRGGSSG